MKLKSYILFFFIVAFWTNANAQDFRKQAPQAGPAPKIEIGDYETFKFKNGLTGIVVENHKLPRVSLQLYFDLPMIAEGDKAGAADIAGDLVGRGTTTRKKAEIDEAVDFIGASLNTGAGGIFGSSLTKHKDKLMAILADVALHPTFPEEEFEKIKTQTLSNLAANKTDPGSIAANVANVLRYGSEHPYGELTTEETVSNITLEDTKAFYDTYFQPSRAYFVVIGDITMKQAKKMAKKYFKKWKGKPVEEMTFQMPEQPESTKVNFVDKTGAVQSVINITYPLGFRLDDAQAISASVLNTILGSVPTGRLHQNLREDKGFTYGARSVIAPDEYVGYFNASASVRNEVTDSALVEFMNEIQGIVKAPVSDTELSQAKSILAGSFGRSLEQPQTMARFALNTVRYKLPVDYYATYLEKLSRVGKDDVMKAAKKFIRPENANILVVGNKGEVADKLKQFDAEGKVNFFDAYGKPVKVEEMGVPAGLTAEKVIENYVAAIGGAEKLSGVKDVTTNMMASVQGQNLETTIKQKTPNMMAMEMKMGGMAMMTQKFDGMKGEAMQMGNPIPLDEAAQAEMKNQAYVFPELRFPELGYKMVLKGVEMVEGKKAYAVEMSTPTGNKSTDYYDITTGLKIRSVSAAQGNSVINDYTDYREVDGIKFPFKTTITGMMPIPLTMEVKSVEVNTGLDAAEFKVNK